MSEDTGAGAAGADPKGSEPAKPPAKRRISGGEVRDTTRNLVENASKRNVVESAAGAVMKHLRETSGVLLSTAGEAFLFDAVDRRVYRVSTRDRGFLAWLWVRFGLPADTTARLVAQAVDANSMAIGDDVPTARFVYWDAERQTLFVSRYDGTMYKLTGDETIAVVPNGDGVIFLDDDGGTACEAIVARHELYAGSLINDLQYATKTAGGLTAIEQQCLFAIWTVALAFPQFLPTKPLLLIDGQAGSGKTSSLQRIQAALHGKVFAHSIGQASGAKDDFGVMLLRSPIALIDNTDTLVEWLRDELCAYTTGGGWIRRKKFSDIDEIEIRPQAFVALATKNPQTFRRDDIADRTILIRLERREGRGGYSPMDELLGAVKKLRPKLFGEWLWICNQVVGKIRAGLPKLSSPHRMADFARLALTIGPVLGYSSDMVESALLGSQRERQAFLQENDTLPDLLDRWASYGEDGVPNLTRTVKLLDLYRELATIAKTFSISFFKSPATLGARLQTPVAGFATTEMVGGLYKFRRASDDE